MAWRAGQPIPADEKASSPARQLRIFQEVARRLTKPTAIVVLAVAAVFPAQARDHGYYQSFARTAKAISDDDQDAQLRIAALIGAMRMMRGGLPLIERAVSAGPDYNLFTDCGSPSFPCRVVVTVAGTIGASSTGSFGFSTGSGWASGTTLLLVNNGIISGIGGAGGGGGNGTGGGANGRAGSAGGGALTCGYPITIDNTNGYIYAGGGGGGGGADYFSGSAGAGGGGGGGGIGYTGAVGGPASSFAPGGGQAAGQSGSSVGGDGGAGGHDGFYNVDGGRGGGNLTQDFGGAGGAGAPTATHSGGAGGASGPATTSNGYTITWTGGHNGTQVKGFEI